MHRSAFVLPVSLLTALVAVGCGGSDERESESLVPTTVTPTTTTAGPETTETTSEPTTETGDPSETGTESGSDTDTTESETDTGASMSDTDPQPVCGDGVVEGNESCDDGNAENTDDCLDTCVAAACGDGFVQDGVEQCDDGNIDNTDDCLDTCNMSACGDGFVQAGVEECDDGNAENSDGCLDTCAPARFGDGFVLLDVEGCDDGNMNDNDECNNACAAASCGDGIVQDVLGEECDDANDDNTDDCLDTCKAASCGDGFLHADVEACDDGGMNNDNSGPCKTDCSVCPCQGDDVMGMTCADIDGFACGTLACAGCEFDTNSCANPGDINFNGEEGPAFNDGCWVQCEGYLDAQNVEDIPAAWGDNCTSDAYSRVRIACGATTDTYRFITVEKNVFKDGLNAYPETGLISESKDQDGNNFTVQDQIYASGNHPHTGTSWWGGGNGCGELNTNITINNGCTYDASNCFGQNINTSRYLWVYVAP